MSRRTYHAKRRARTTEETRQRLVEATFALHGEQGNAATTMKQIAARAGVSVGTVYHHFPTYSDAIRACGAHSELAVPRPTAAVFGGLASRRERLAALVEALFRYYERLPAFDWVRRERNLDPTLDSHVRAEEENRLALAAKALGVSRRESRARLAAALMDAGVFAACRALGLGRVEAAAKVSDVIEAWLVFNEGGQERSRPKPSRKVHHGNPRQ